MAASLIRSVNVGQNESDTKEFHKNLNFFISLFQRSLFKPFHQEDQPTVVPGRGNSLIRLALYLPRYPQMNLPLFLLAKVRRKIGTAKSLKNMKVAKFLKYPKYPL